MSTENVSKLDSGPTSPVAGVGESQEYDHEQLTYVYKCSALVCTFFFFLKTRLSFKLESVILVSAEYHCGLNCETKQKE